METNFTNQELDSKFFVHYASEWIKDILSLSLEYDKYSVINKAIRENIKLRRFKRHNMLPRIKIVLSILKNWQPKSILDIGIGNGSFIWPLLDTFPDIRIHAADKFTKNGVDAVNAASRVRKGITGATLCDCSSMPFKDGEFDCVTALEVLEHIPDNESAMKELVRVTNRSLIVSVPSIVDTNPDHVHFFDEKYLIDRFTTYGLKNIKTERVPEHLVLYGSK